MKATVELKQELQQNKHEALIKELYVDSRRVDTETKRYIEAITKYEQLFGEGKVGVFSAPGRSEIGGNHTDHQQGRVLAASVNVDFLAVAGSVEEPVIQVLSEGYEMITVDVTDLSLCEEEKGTTKAIIKGMIKGFVDAGYNVGGFNAYITSEVLSGSGLSSSAGLETLIGTIVSGLYNEQKVSPVKIAKLGQYAENVYFGKPSGLMDQMASSVGDIIYIDFKDKETPVIEKIEVEFERAGYSLCIVDTKGSHDDLTDEYAAIPVEMKQIAAQFGKDHLREVEKKAFYQQLPTLRKTCGDRAVLRAIHFFEENDRVVSQVEALKSGDMDRFLKLVQASGNSSYKYLQNIYVPSNVKEQNMSIALAVSDSILGDNGVCRVHGGGFAGTIQAFVKDAFVETYKEAIEQVFGEGTCHVLKIRKHGGEQVL